MKEYNLALEVQVTPEDYPKVLMTIRNKKALVLLLVDLTDFPCSIWPGVADILGQNTPILIIGNKIDLLAKDNETFLHNIKNNLLNNVRLFGFGSTNVLDVVLISAKTGFGVENLITSIHTKWKHKGNIYFLNLKMELQL